MFLASLIWLIFTDFFIQQSTEILIESTFWLGVYVRSILDSHFSWFVICSLRMKFKNQKKIEQDNFPLMIELADLCKIDWVREGISCYLHALGSKSSFTFPFENLDLSNTYRKLYYTIIMRVFYGIIIKQCIDLFAGCMCKENHRASSSSGIEPILSWPEERAQDIS